MRNVYFFVNINENKINNKKKNKVLNYYAELISKNQNKKHSVAMVPLFFWVSVNDAFLLLFVFGHAKRAAKLKGNVTKLGTDKAD